MVGVLVLVIMVGLGFVGFLDDFLKIRNQRSLGLGGWAKIAGRSSSARSSPCCALSFRDENGLTPASTYISGVRDIPWLNFIALRSDRRRHSVRDLGHLSRSARRTASTSLTAWTGSRRAPRSSPSRPTSSSASGRPTSRASASTWIPRSHTSATTRAIRSTSRRRPPRCRSGRARRSTCISPQDPGGC